MTAQFDGGALESVRLDQGPSIAMWAFLEPYPSADDWLDRSFDITAARRHLRPPAAGIELPGANPVLR